MNANASITPELLEGSGVAPTLFSLGIDVRTQHSAKLRAALSLSPDVVSAMDGGVYREDAHYSQIWVETTMSEDELDRRLWATKHGCDYVGVFTR